MTIDQIIALFSSMGACLAAVATLLTIREMKKQREALYHPELVLSETIFRASPSSTFKGSLPVNWVRLVENIEIPSLEFSMPLINIGFGSAKGVVVSWKFPIEDCVAKINEYASRADVGGKFTLKNGVFSVQAEKYGSFTSIWKNQRLRNIDYVLPASAEGEPQMLPLPFTYILAVGTVLAMWSSEKRTGEL